MLFRSVICTDKTGTLTRNEMTARRIMTARHTLIASGSGYVPEGHIEIAGSGDQTEAMAEAMPLIRCGLLCNDASLRKVGGEKVVKRIRREPDPFIQKIVSGWPRAFDAKRATALGFKADSSFEEILRIHVEDELGGKIA